MGEYTSMVVLVSRGNSNRVLPDCSCARLLPPEHRVLGVGRSPGLPGPGSGCYGNQQYRGRCPLDYWAVKHSGTGCLLLGGGDKHVWNKYPLLFLHSLDSVLYYASIQCKFNAMLLAIPAHISLLSVSSPSPTNRLPISLLIILIMRFPAFSPSLSQTTQCFLACFPFSPSITIIRPSFSHSRSHSLALLALSPPGSGMEMDVVGMYN